jgi:hypothetical protein
MLSHLLFMKTTIKGNCRIAISFNVVVVVVVVNVVVVDDYAVDMADVVAQRGGHFINPIMLSLVNKYVVALVVVGMTAKKYSYGCHF